MAKIVGLPITFSCQDADLKYLWVENLPAGWSDLTGKTDADFLPAAAAAIAEAAKRSVLSGGESRRIELPVRSDAGVRHFELYIEPDRDRSGAVVGVVCATIELTGTSRRPAATLETLLREVSHRSKNLLAIVQSLAAQTARTARSTDAFVARFNGRLQSLSRSQDLITDANWRGASLRELIQTQVEPYVVDAARQVAFSGDDYDLLPNAALHVGLALHELAANAVQDGAFSTPAGRVSIVTGRSDPADGNLGDAPLSITWTESGGPPVKPPDRSEFGHVLLDRVVPASVGGQSRTSFDRAGVRYELTVARWEFE